MRTGAQRRLRDTVTSAGRRSKYLRDGSWDDETLAGLLRGHAQANPDKPAVIDRSGARTRTFGELDADSDLIAARLHAVGVRPGDVVSVQLPNWYETVVVDLGVLKLGAVLNMLLPIYREHELREVIRTAGTRVLFTPQVYRGFDYVEMVRKLRQEAALDGHVVVRDPDVEAMGFTGWSAELVDGEPWAPGTLAAADVSEVMFSSGTESRPKAIMHTEQTVSIAVRTAARSLAVTEDDVVWMASPVGHSTGFNYGVRFALHCGCTLVLQDKWSADAALRLIEQTRPTYTVAATTFLSDLVEAARRTGADLSCLRLFGSGGAPVPAALVLAAAERGTDVLRLYGSTEVLVVSWNRPDSPMDKKVNTDGLTFDTVELQVRAPSGEPLIGRAGELFARGPSVCVGFLDDPERTLTSFDDEGWLATGDVGVLDEQGYFSMVSRKKEILIRGGLNVAPREIEELVAQFPEVREVAVVAMPHPRLGEIGCACIVLNAGATLTLSALTDRLREQGLAAFKLPEQLEVLDELPRTLTGKIQKFEIVKSLQAPGARAEHVQMSTRD